MHVRILTEFCANQQNSGLELHVHRHAVFQKITKDLPPCLIIFTSLEAK